MTGQSGLSFASMMNQGMNSTPTNQAGLNSFSMTTASTPYAAQNQASLGYTPGQAHMTPVGSLTMGELAGARRSGRVGSSDYSNLSAMLEDASASEAQGAYPSPSLLADESSMFYSIPPSLLQMGVEKIVVSPTSVVVFKRGLGVKEDAGMKILLLSRKTGINRSIHERISYSSS